MVDEDYRHCTCRLYPKEREYLDSHNFSFSDYVHASIRRDIELERNNKTQNIFQTHSFSILLVGFGSFFIFYMFSQIDLIGWLLCFLIGVFLMVTGLINLILEVAKRVGRF